MPYANGPGDVLDLVLAQIGERGVNTITDLFVRAAGNADAAWRRHVFEARRDVHAVAVDFAFLDNDLVYVDADAGQHALVLGQIGVPLGHSGLNLDRAFNRRHDARKFNEDAIARAVHDAAVVFLYRRLPKFSAMRLHCRERAGFVRAHQARIASHVRQEDCRETSLHRRISQTSSIEDSRTVNEQSPNSIRPHDGFKLDRC